MESKAKTKNKWIKVGLTNPRLYLDYRVVRIRLIVKNHVSSDAIIGRRYHQRHGLSVVHVHKRRGRRDRGRAIVLRRNSAQRPVVVDSRKNEADLVLDFFVV